MATMKSSLTTKVPSPANQGGHRASAETVQKTAIQKKSGPVGTGASTVKYSAMPSGTRGSSKGAK